MKTKNNFLKKRNLSYKISNNILISFKYAYRGINYCLHSSRNFRIECFLGISILILAFIFKLKFYEYLILISTVFSVLILELLNSSIESLVDLVVQNKYSKLAKISKDCSAGAVLLAAINSIFVAGFIFLPKIKILVQNL
tara:strand:- start:408 stop:827 length:420 start_codon:yes stop_codon:yes gene_type:complete